MHTASVLGIYVWPLASHVTRLQSMLRFNAHLLSFEELMWCRGAFGLPSSAAQQQAAQQNRFSGANMAVNMQPVRFFSTDTPLLHQHVGCTAGHAMPILTVKHQIL